MSIVTFYNNNKEQTGKTMSIAAIATFMSIEHNYRILIVSTTNEEDNLKNCFWEEKRKKRNLGIFGPNASLEVQNGVEGLTRIIRSNKITPDIITNYTKVVFKDRLEVLLGSDKNESNSPELQNIGQVYPEIIKSANQYYDLVLIDLDENIDEETKNTILNMSDVVIVNLNQRLRSVNKYAEDKMNNEIQARRKLILIGKYDRYSKYNSKNITRYLGEKNQVLTVPYNTLFMEAGEEAGVPDLFLRFRKMTDTEDSNGFFISEVRRASENIIYRLQDLQMKL